MAVTLTEKAAEHVRRTLGDAKALRLGVKSSGCSGYMYTVDPADRITEQDQVFESHGVRIVVDAKSLEFLDGTCVDYGLQGLNEGFMFDNPNVTNACGCGESFQV